MKKIETIIKKACVNYLNAFNRTSAMFGDDEKLVGSIKF